MEHMYFDEFGFLGWLEPKEYYAKAWRFVGTAEGDDGERYDIVEMDNEYRYTNI